MARERRKRLPAKTKGVTPLDLTATLVSVVPWLGGPVSNVLSGISLGRKFGRVQELLEGWAKDLKGFRSEVSENYVKSEDFEDLLEQTLRQVAIEHNKEKRRIYRSFLSDAVKSPGESYDERIRLLKTLEQFHGDHIRVIRAIMQEPEKNLHSIGSPVQTLRRRLPDLPQERIEDLVQELENMRIIKLVPRLRTTMTPEGAAKLRGALTSFGLRLVAFIQQGE